MFDIFSENLEKERTEAAKKAEKTSDKKSPSKKDKKKSGNKTDKNSGSNSISIKYKRLAEMSEKREIKKDQDLDELVGELFSESGLSTKTVEE